MLSRRTLPGEVHVLVPERMEAAGFLVAFTERTGGASGEPFSSLNLGLGSGDDLDVVRENRRRVCAALGIGPFAMVRQVHGARLVRAGRRRAGAGYHHWTEALGSADAITTAARAVPIAVLAADCTPVALADPRSGRIAVAHAGWKGIVAGVVQSALASFEDPGRVMAAIGPAVGMDHFEVGEEVARAVGDASPTGVPTRRRRGGRPHIDIRGAVEGILRGAGVRDIESAPECTACEEARFYSYRRDGTTGRQLVVAVRP